MFPSFTPGEWYLTISCSSCKKRIPVFTDLSKGKSEIVGGYNLACPGCGHKDKYERDQIERYQHPKAENGRP